MWSPPFLNVAQVVTYSLSYSKYFSGSNLVSVILNIAYGSHVVSAILDIAQVVMWSHDPPHFKYCPGSHVVSIILDFSQVVMCLSLLF